MAMSSLLLIPMIKNKTHSGDSSPRTINQGDHIYIYTEPKPMYQSMWSVWDSKWYISIAEDGYSNQKYPYRTTDNKGFMPLYPILIWLFSTFILLGNSHLAGFLISNIFLILSFYFLKKFVESEERLKDKVNIENTYLYLLFFPTSYFLSSIYPESLFLFLSILTFYLINKNKIIWACIVIGLAFITKVFGIFLLIPLGFYIFKNKKIIPLKKLISYILTLSVIPLSYLFYMFKVSNDALAYLHIQEAFFRHNWVNPLQTIFIDIFCNTSSQTLLHGLITIFALVVIVLGHKIIKLEYLLYSLCYILFTPLTGMVNGNARYIASLFFIPIILSVIIKSENIKLIYVYIISFIQGFIFIWWLIGSGFTS